MQIVTEITENVASIWDWHHRNLESANGIDAVNQFWEALISTFMKMCYSTIIFSVSRVLAEC